MRQQILVHVLAWFLFSIVAVGCTASRQGKPPGPIGEQVVALTDILEEQHGVTNTGIYESATELGRIGLEYCLPDRTIVALSRVANDDRVAMHEFSDWTGIGGGSLVYLNLDAARVAFLKWELKDCRNEQQRVQALWAQLSDEKGGAGIRMFCIDRLREVGPAAIPYLAAAAADSGKAASWYVSGMAITSLGTMLPRGRDVLLLIAESESGAGSVARRVLTDFDLALGGHYPEDAEPLASRLHNARWEVRRRAIMAIAKERSPRALELLVESLEDDDCLVRQAAAVALGRLGDKQALAALMTATQDMSFLVRLAAYESFDYLGVDADTALLARAMADPLADVRWWAVRRMARNIDNIPIELLHRAVTDVDCGVRSLAVKVLAECSCDVTDVLLKALDDGEGTVRIEAARALGHRKERAAAGRLCAMVKSDELPIARAVAADALGLISDPSCGQALVKALEDEDSDVRASAASALGIVGYRGAVEAIWNIAQNDPYDSVRKAATSALEKLTKQ
jgi:HEAT repeat protein